jgi:hypothetical protein
LHLERLVVWPAIVFGSLLVVLLVALAIYFGRHQVMSLRRLRQEDGLPEEERRYERGKAQRRLVSCALLLVLAALLVVVAFDEPWTQRLAEERANFDSETAPAFTPQQKVDLQIWGGMWIAFLLVLMVVLLLAAVDLLSTRRYALRQYRKLQADRRAMIERQANRMRRDRNGHG